MTGLEGLEGFFHMAEVSRGITKSIKNMETSEALTCLSIALDEYAAFHDLDGLELWEMMHETARAVYNKMGGADYIKTQEGDNEE